MRASERCERCGSRWKQDGGLCRQCAIDTGVSVRTTVERERDHLAKVEARIVRVGPPLPRAEITIDGVEWVVMFDGS